MKVLVPINIQDFQPLVEDKLWMYYLSIRHESLIYEFRDFLRDESNFMYVKESDRDSLMEKLETSEEWLYDDGSDVGYKVYQEKSYDLMTDYSKFKKRKE